nr:TetR/AcrR family transcriptional regulator [Aureibacillus halotolerans]
MKGIILSTASRLFCTQGYHGTGLNQIIKESGSPKGSLYHYFPNGKEQLAAEAIAGVTTDSTTYFKQLFHQEDDLVSAFERMFSKQAECFNESKNFSFGAWPIGLLSLEVSGESERIREACDSYYDVIQCLWAEQLQSYGHTENESRQIALSMIAMIEGAIILCCAQQNAQPLLAIQPALVKLIKRDRASHPKGELL